MFPKDAPNGKIIVPDDRIIVLDDLGRVVVLGDRERIILPHDQTIGQQGRRPLRDNQTVGRTSLEKLTYGERFSLLEYHGRKKRGGP